MFGWNIDARDAWKNPDSPSYGGQVQDAFELPSEDHTARFAPGSGTLKGKPPPFHVIESNYTLSAEASFALRDKALLLTCSYNDDYWLEPEHFVKLGEAQLKAAVSCEARWNELHALLRRSDPSKSHSASVLTQLRL